MWAVVLGGSSGIGWACVKELVKLKYNVFIVHRDGKIATRNFLDEVEKLRHEYSVQIQTLNANINIEESKNLIKENLLLIPKNHVNVFIHSIADGHIKPLFSNENFLTEEDLLYTLNSMGVSFYSWTKFLFDNKLFAENSYIFGFTSEGSRRVIKNYAAVGTAKAVLETLCKYMAYELAQYKIYVNLLSPGVTKTKAIRVFPDVDNFITEVERKNPFKTLTTPEKVATFLSAIVKNKIDWLSGEVIHIDGGEQNVF
ncbi:MAG: SDR family oxidoreductase [Bacteroidales bacterium]|nr:SDR family oxidoreductase [Bacteroidales bacterium]